MEEPMIFCIKEQKGRAEAEEALKCANRPWKYEL